LADSFNITLNELVFAIVDEWSEATFSDSPALGYFRWGNDGLKLCIQMVVLPKPFALATTLNFGF